jgi:alpha,alpha-trehalose phosphorylase
VLTREIVGLPTTIYPVDEWALVETDFDQDYLARAETIFSLGNGYVGIRGCVDEGRPYFDRGSYVNGFHETWPIRHAEDAYGFARTGQTIVPVPDARRFHLYVEGEPLHLPTADIEEYERRLDFRTGVLERRLLWRSPSGDLVRVTSSRLVSMVHRHVIAMRYEVELVEGAAPITLSSQLRHEVSGQLAADDAFDPRAGRGLGDVLVADGQEANETRSILRFRVRESGMTLGCGIDHIVTVEGGVEDHARHCEVDDRRAKMVLRVDATAGTRIVIEKFAAYYTSRTASTKQLADRAHRGLDRCIERGWDTLAEEQRAWFDDAWQRGDVRIEGSPVVQQAVRWSLFQLLQATARAETAGIPAKGLTGGGYEGHYFWDTEIYVLPFLTYTMPAIARNLLRFRHTMLDKARERATELSQRGALFPWRTINGEEASAYYEAGTAQYHIDADISYALRTYARATGDTGFLTRYGAEMLVETARMWEDLGFHGGDGAFHLHGVTGPDEYTTLVNDNAYTNLLAQLNLRYAAEVVGQLDREDPDAFDRLSHRTTIGPGEVDAWRRAADAMYVPFDEERGITPQDVAFLDKEVWDFEGTPREKYPLLLHFHPLVIYRFQVIKQADIVLAMFLRPECFDEELVRRNFEYYDPLTTGDSSLSTSIQSIVATRIGLDARALEYFRYGLFMDLADVAGNAEDGVHVAATGGVWLSLVYGFGGMRDDGDELAFAPSLPGGWSRLSFAVTRHGQRLRVSVTRFETTYAHESGDEPISFSHRGTDVRLEPGEKRTLTMSERMRPTDEGPAITP